MTVLLPLMVYFIVNVLQNLLKFVQLLHTEDMDDEAGLLSGNQIDLLFTVCRNMLGYFGLYSVSGELDRFMIMKPETVVNYSTLMPSIIALQFAFLIQLIKNYRKRAAIARALGQDSNAGFLGATGLTTLFNALTQTTTTFCANG